ncbi:hypothetical protein [Terrabacter ginsenosidimutans]|jgi:hypothetical protein
MSFMGRLERRWDARQTGMELVGVEVSVEISVPAKDLWSFILHPKSAQLTDPRVVNAFRVPGTPVEEVGEQQCIVSDRGGVLSAQIGEIVALEAPRLVAVRWLTLAGGFISRHLLDDLGRRSRLMYQLEGQVLAGSGKSAQKQMRTDAAESLARWRTAVESGARFPA